MSEGLLGKEATGGATARVGFEYQDAFVLKNLPEWLAQPAFSHVVSEAIGDVEVCYFCPFELTKRRTYEAKNYALTESAFWSEVQDFHRMFTSSPAEFVEFVLICPDFKPSVRPILNQLKRLRGVGASYPSNSPVIANTREQIIAAIVVKSQTQEFAEFVVDRVHFEIFSDKNVDQLFPGVFHHAFPTIEMSTSTAATLGIAFRSLIFQSSSSPVKRKDLEKAIARNLGERKTDWSNLPTMVRVANGPLLMVDLGVDAMRFNSPGNDANAEDWGELLDALNAIAHFIRDSTTRSGIQLESRSRMTMSCAVGFAFGATLGFWLEIVQNGASYPTRIHTKTGKLFFESHHRPTAAVSESGVVSIAFPTSIAEAAVAAVEKLTGSPNLRLVSSRTIATIEELNDAVTDTKERITHFRSENQVGTLHLFLKAPAFFAMALGHRLNGLGKIQMYDWTGTEYRATATISA